MTNILKTLPQGSPLSEEQISYLTEYFSVQSSLVSSSDTVGSSCVVMFGTQTGNAESVANDIAQKLNATVMDMADVEPEHLKIMTQIVIVASTYGDGEQTDNAQIMWDACHDIGALPNLQYAVLALGDTAYDLFCQAGEDWDTLLQKSGATRVQDTVKLDVDYEEEAEAWGDALIPIFGSSLKSDAVADISIMFGTQTGNSESVARDIANLFNVEPIDMADVDGEAFKAMNNIVIVTSTYGDGEQPDNAQIMWDACQEISDMTGKKYAVLALGDTAYDLFCQAGEDWDTLLQKAGATRVQDTAKLDVDYEEEAETWASQLKSSFGEIATLESAITTTTPSEPGHKSIYTKSNPYMGTMLTNKTLSGDNSSKQVCHFEFDINDPEMSYEAGDALGIIALNSDTLIEAILKAGNWTGEEGIQGVALREVLRTKEIRLPSKDLIKTVAEKSNNKTLLAMLDDKSAMADYLYGREVADVLQDCTTDFKAGDFAALLKPLAHRLYSISSSPNAHKGQVHLTVAAVRYDFSNRQCEGVASCFLADRTKAGDKVAMFLHANKNFSIPNNDEAPMIMVGPGTGIAPFRGFIEERMSRGATGDNWLFFGDRTRSEDYLYKDQLQAWESNNTLRLSLAWSRQEGVPKTYVQNKMLAEGGDIFVALEKGGYFFICGDASRMAKDVEAALLEIISTHGAMPVEKAMKYLDIMKKEKRYVRDVY